MTDLLSACERETDRLIRTIRELVACESPSGNREALVACAAVFESHLIDAGARVERRGGGATGKVATGNDATAPHLLASWPGDGPPVLLMGHLDTVWPIGQIQHQPLEVRDGRLFGPGVYDMKGGLGIGVAAIRALAAVTSPAARPAIRLLATTDEEVGSTTSRALIEELARESSAVLVLEPALANGAVKTSRKGVGDFEIVATGIAAHAGVDPGAGASAIHEIARVVYDVIALADPAAGLTLNVGVIEGGSRPNVVAERARVEVDVRITRLDQVARIENALRELRARDPRVTLSVTGGINRPPMERSAGVERLYHLARDVAREQGWELSEGSTGGGSDGNFSAALGVPTLDGLGATGDGAHARHEHVIIKDLVPRAALLAGLLRRLGDNG